MRYNAEKQEFKEKRRVFQGGIRERSGKLSITLHQSLKRREERGKDRRKNCIRD